MRLLEISDPVLVPVVGMYRLLPHLLIQTSESLWLTQEHSSLYTVPFDTKKWIEGREGRWRKMGGMERGKEK